MVLAFMLACNFTTFTANAQQSNNQPKAVVVPLNMQDSDRYVVAKPYKFHSLVEFKQPIYAGPETIKNLVVKTAQEIGLEKALVVNEATHVGVEVIVGSAGKFLVDKEFGIPLYMVGCKDRNGKPFYNRITVLKKVESKPVVVVETVPVATPAQKEIPTEVRYEKPKTVSLKSDSGYNIDQKSAKGNIVIVPAIRLLPTVAVVDVPVPDLSANGRSLNNGNPAQAQVRKP